MDINPILKLDYPDIDVIRVDDTYYMVSTTMHFMPGCEILRSYDLVNWEHLTYVYETLDSTPEQRLVGNKNIYGKGMWAASIRFHEGKFYICFVANDTQKTYLYISNDINGPWSKHIIEGFYHDCSLLFDNDNVYIVYGNKDVRLTQLNKELTAPLEGGLNRIIISDTDNQILGYEGAHIYKINNKYYIFLIHSRPDRWMRTQACFVAETLDSEFKGKDVLEDDRDYCGQGVAQGGIVDTPQGNWYALLFQDHGAVGRIPILTPISWKNSFPIFGDNGKIPSNINITSTKPSHQYTPLVGSDNFKYPNNNDHKYILSPKWQFNHEPDKSSLNINTEDGTYEITTNKICTNLLQATNTITQRMLFPSCSAEVTIDAHNLKEGDYAGLCAFQGCYGMVAITLRNNQLYIVMINKATNDQSINPTKPNSYEGTEQASIPINTNTITLKVEVDFMNMKDEATFYYKENNEYKQIGTNHKLYFKLDHFTGCRFGLFLYSTKQVGGNAKFKEFNYYTPVTQPPKLNHNLTPLTNNDEIKHQELYI